MGRIVILRGRVLLIGKRIPRWKDVLKELFENRAVEKESASGSERSSEKRRGMHACYAEFLGRLGTIDTSEEGDK